MNKLLKNLLKLVNSNIKNSFNTREVIFHKNSSLIVNGKKVDPESPEGKRVIKKIEIEMTKLEKDMEKMGEELGRMFK